MYVKKFCRQAMGGSFVFAQDAWHGSASGPKDDKQQGFLDPKNFLLKVRGCSGSWKLTDCWCVLYLRKVARCSASHGPLDTRR